MWFLQFLWDGRSNIYSFYLPQKLHIFCILWNCRYMSLKGKDIVDEIIEFDDAGCWEWWWSNCIPNGYQGYVCYHLLFLVCSHETSGRHVYEHLKTNFLCCSRKLCHVILRDHLFWSLSQIWGKLMVVYLNNMSFYIIGRRNYFVNNERGSTASKGRAKAYSW